MRLRLYIAVMLFISSMMLNAQTTIDGTVVDERQMPIPDVTVAASQQVLTTSDSKGHFAIGCPADSVSLWVDFTCVGYQMKRVRLYKGERNVEIVMRDNVVDVGEITIQASKYSRFSNYTAQMVKMNPFDIYTNPQALGDVFGSMRVIPGVQRNDNDGRLIIQGGATDETQIIVDGLILFNPYSLEQRNVSVRSRFSPDLFNGVALQSSGYGAQFGNALSGILQLNTLAKADMLEKTDLKISSVSVESTVIKNIGKNTSVRANLSYMNLTPYGNIVKDSYQWNKYFNQYAGDFFMVNQLKGGIEMKYHISYSKSGADYSYDHISGSSARNNLREHNFLASAVADIPLSTTSNLYAGFNFAHNRFSGTDVSYIGDSVGDIRIHSHQKIAYCLKISSITNSAGIENVLSKLDESYLLDSLYRLQYSNNQWAIYDELSVLSGRFSWNMGIRGEYSTCLQKMLFSPRMYVACKMSAQHILSLSLGKYSQLPNEKYLKFTDRITYNESTGATLTYGYVNKLST